MLGELQYMGAGPKQRNWWVGREDMSRWGPAKQWVLSWTSVMAARTQARWKVEGGSLTLPPHLEQDRMGYMNARSHSRSAHSLAECLPEPWLFLSTGQLGLGDPWNNPKYSYSHYGKFWVNSRFFKKYPFLLLLLPIIDSSLSLSPS